MSLTEYMCKTAIHQLELVREVFTQAPPTFQLYDEDYVGCRDMVLLHINKAIEYINTMSSVCD